MTHQIRRLCNRFTFFDRSCGNCLVGCSQGPSIQKERGAPHSFRMCTFCMYIMPSFFWQLADEVVPHQSITSIYRLCVMSTTTTSLISTASGSQNTPAEKAAFYIFHILPEYISVLILLSCNVRDVFGTGMFGDRRFRDETQREKEIKETNELYQLDKKAGSAVGIYDEEFRMFARVRHLWRPKV
jgi:hypothetical protein